MRKINQDQFIANCIAVHGDKYDYSLIKYISSRRAVTIICKEHGVFTQIASNHSRGQTCPKCAWKQQAYNRGLHIKPFIDRAKEVYGDRYDYSLVEYIHSEKKVKIICSKHGIFEQTPKSHLHNGGCYKCGRDVTGIQNRGSIEGFILKAKAINRNLYDYNKTQYETRDKLVIVTCRIHGDFTIVANHHLNGIGCPKCRYKGYDKKAFIKFCKNRDKSSCIFYVLNIYRDNENFIKIGITSNTIKERFRKLEFNSGYKYNLLYQLITTPEKVWDIEYTTKRLLKRFRYKPQVFYVGHSESFLISSIPIIKQHLKLLGYDIRGNESSSC